MTDLEKLVLETLNPKVVERFTLPARPERRKRAPGQFQEGATGQWLRAYIGGDQPWRHQSIALQHIVAGKNVVLATATASGKTFAFMAAIIDQLLRKTNARMLVLYPLKALSADQLERWYFALDLAGLPRDFVGEITGDVPMAERDVVLARAKIVLANEDVVHAWMMSQVSSPAMQSFLADLKFLVIDEAHALEGVFGTNSALLFRRVRAAKAAIGDGPENLPL